MSNITLQCNKHALKFEYPDYWDEKKLRPPGCPLCKDEERAKYKRLYTETKSERDLLLSAIELKINSESEEAL